MNGFQILRISEWIIKFAYIHLLWICFSIIGGLILGVFPATVAMFGVIRRWLQGDTDIPVLKTFYIFYKNTFIKSNVLGFFLSITGFAFYIYFQLIDQTSGIFIKVLFYLLLIMTFMFIMTALYIFPIFVQNRFTVLEVFKNAFFMMIISPWSTIMIISTIIIYSYIILHFSGLIFIFGISPLVLIIMLSTNLSYLNIRKKKEMLN